MFNHHAASQNVNALRFEVAPGDDFAPERLDALHVLFAEEECGRFLRPFYKILGDIQAQPARENRHVGNEFARLCVVENEHYFLHAPKRECGNQHASAAAQNERYRRHQPLDFAVVGYPLRARVRPARCFDNKRIDPALGRNSPLQDSRRMERDVARKENAPLFVLEHYRRRPRNMPRGRERDIYALAVDFELPLAVERHRHYARFQGVD